MRILTVSAEFSPHAKTGGLGDAVAGLCHALTEAGHDVRLLTPAYAGRYPEVATAAVEVQLPQTSTQAAIGDLPALPWVKLLHHEVFQDQQIYSGNAADAHRFALLSAAALSYCQQHKWAPDVIHCHDWHTALVPGYLRQLVHWDKLFQQTSTLLTIHNAAFQGQCHENWHALVCKPDPEHDHVNILRHGMSYADAVSTVSQSYAQEISTHGHEAGLHDLLNQTPALGIINGIDQLAWSPTTDPHLEHNYEQRTATSQRAKNKHALTQELGFANADLPLFGAVCRLTEQKGIDLIVDQLPHLLHELRANCVIIGSGIEDYETQLRRLADEHKEQMHFFCGYNEPLSHRVIAGSDFLMVPSLFEPCGLTQLYAMNYGTIPIVRNTGGLRDTVAPLETDHGTGIVFDDFDSNAMHWALSQANTLYETPLKMQQVINRAMQQDFGWQTQAAEYTALYRRLCGRDEQPTAQQVA
ncbi:MAG: glycogen synthase [Pseudomonadota bacterium]